MGIDTLPASPFSLLVTLTGISWFFLRQSFDGIILTVHHVDRTGVLKPNEAVHWEHFFFLFREEEEEEEEEEARLKKREENCSLEEVEVKEKYLHRHLLVVGYVFFKIFGIFLPSMILTVNKRRIIVIRGGIWLA